MHTKVKAAGLAMVGALVGCAELEVSSESQTIGGKYIVSCSSALSAGFAAKVSQRGDALGHYFPEAGFAVVSTSRPNNYAAVGCAVVQDVRRQWLAPGQQFETTVANPPTSNDDDFLFDAQWGADAVNAPEAWAAGVRGTGVRVAVLDTGFELSHPDLAPNINYGLSRDFTGEGLQYTLNDPFSHGTHTAGTIAAADNGFGVIGIAPEAELVLVKVLGDGGSGSFGDVLAGMVHATNVDARIVSMSLGATFPKMADIGPNKLVVAMNHVASYARRNGTTIIAAVGNDNLDLDRGPLTNLPSDATGVIGVSATAPHDWALNPAGSLDHRAGYSNYGVSAVDLAGPGGDVYREPNFDQFCQVGVVFAPCFVFDLVLSTGSSVDGDVYWFWAGGTSMATPHAAGVAALLASKPGNTTPVQLEQALRATASDLGQPGTDPVYGAGRVSSGF